MSRLIIIKTGQILKLFFNTLFIIERKLTTRYGGCQRKHCGFLSKCLNDLRIQGRVHGACQFLVTLCTEPQKPSKLPECTDDNVSESATRAVRGYRPNPIANAMKRPGLTMLNQTPVTSEFDLCRIDSIRTKLADDDYTVDSLQIADKIIDLELALSGNT